MPPKSKSRSRRPSRANKPKRKTVVQDGIHFLALVAGLITGATVVLLIIGMFQNRNTAPEILVADKSDLAEVVVSVNSSELHTFGGNASKEKLLETLASLNQLQPKAGSNELMNVLRRRSMMADQLLRKPLDADQNRFVVMSKINALTKLFGEESQLAAGGIADSTAIENLLTSKVADPDPEIRKLARTKLARLNSLSADKNLRPYGRELYGLLRDYPNDEEVAKTIHQCLSVQLRSSDQYATASELVNFILSQPKIEEGETAKKTWRHITDLSYLCDRGFLQLYADREIAGPAELQQLTDVCVDLLQVPDLGSEGFLHLQRAAEWLEQNSHYQHAREIYTQAKKSSMQLTDKSVAKSANRMSAQGTIRCNAVGQPINLQGYRVDGQPVALRQLEGFPVIIVFWRVQDGNVSKRFANIDKATTRWRKQAVKIIAVQVGRIPPEQQKANQQLQGSLIAKFPNWVFIDKNPDGSTAIFSQVPFSNRTRIMLLDRQHQLVDTDVQMNELQAVVKSVLARRR